MGKTTLQRKTVNKTVGKKTRNTAGKKRTTAFKHALQPNYPTADKKEDFVNQMNEKGIKTVNHGMDYKELFVEHVLWDSNKGLSEKFKELKTKNKQLRREKKVLMKQLLKIKNIVDGDDE